MWFVPWLPLQIHGCPVLGSPVTVVFLLFQNLPWSFMPPGPLYLLLLIPENMPLKITFFHSFYHLLCAEFLTTCPKLRCTWTSQCCEKANVVPVPAFMELAVPWGKQTLIRCSHHQCQMATVSWAAEVRPTGQIRELSEVVPCGTL